MRLRLLTTFILALSVSACGPAMEPGGTGPNILKSGDNSEDNQGGLEDLFEAQDPVAEGTQEEQNDTSGDTFGLSGGDAPLIVDGPNLDEVAPEPVMGPPPINLEEEAEVSGSQAESAPTTTSQNEFGGYKPAEQTLSDEEDVTQSAAETAKSANVDQNTGEEERPSQEPIAQVEPEPESTPTFNNSGAKKIYDQVIANTSIPFRRSNSLKLFWGRFDAFLEGRYVHTVTPADREVLKIPRCSGTVSQPLQSRWPHLSQYVSLPPIFTVYVEPINSTVDINAPLALLDREYIHLANGEEFNFPYYNILETSSHYSQRRDPILDHMVENRGDLAYLSIAASKEIFQRAMFHATQMMTDSKASLDLAAACLSGGGPETLSCPEYRQAFEIHQKAQSVQRLALALVSAESDATCQNWIQSAVDLSERSECLFKDEISHDPNIWGVKTFYNPLRNLTRRSSDIDHWEKPERITPAEKQQLLSLLTELLMSKQGTERWSQLVKYRNVALNVYRNITLLFPSLRFVRSVQMNEGDFSLALQKVKQELSDTSLYYENFKSLRLFPLAILSRLESDAPVEMCDIADEVIHSWQPDVPLSGLLALDKSFLFIPLEFHRKIPLQVLGYNTFEGVGWEYIGQTLYDFAETRAWAFLAASSDETIKVTSHEVIQVATEAMRTQGVEPSDQANTWLQNSSTDLLKELVSGR
jgi:hypothetical protein